jgi:hypothetical protein
MLVQDSIRVLIDHISRHAHHFFSRSLDHMAVRRCNLRQSLLTTLSVLGDAEAAVRIHELVLIATVRLLTLTSSQSLPGLRFFVAESFALGTGTARFGRCQAFIVQETLGYFHKVAILAVGVQDAETFSDGLHQDLLVVKVFGRGTGPMLHRSVFSGGATLLVGSQVVGGR